MFVKLLMVTSVAGGGLAENRHLRSSIGKTCNDAMQDCEQGQMCLEHSLWAMTKFCVNVEDVPVPASEVDGQLFAGCGTAKKKPSQTDDGKSCPCTHKCRAETSAADNAQTCTQGRPAPVCLFGTLRSCDDSDNGGYDCPPGFWSGGWCRWWCGAYEDTYCGYCGVPRWQPQALNPSGSSVAAGEWFNSFEN